MWQEDARWSEDAVREIIGIENLGLVDAEDDPIDVCHLCKYLSLPLDL
jgi:hypothetical protein